ncbi:recombination and repair protein RecT [Bacteroidales bacterium Barb6]|nr:recombination and repair protein RecT [Bacteroidales bacterium Barb6]
MYEGEIASQNRFTGEIVFNPAGKKSDTVIGYVAYFSLINGFEKYLYMTKEECEKRGKKYSQMYKKGYGKWSDDFDAMARKTVLKLLLSRFGILSVDCRQRLHSTNRPFEAT